MDRRAFVAGSLAILAAPLAGEAQGPAKIPRIGVLRIGSPTDKRRQASMHARFVHGMMVLLTWSAALAVAHGGPAFGPKDGAGLPPTELDRVTIGSAAPDFTLESKDGTVVTLSSFRDRKSVVLVFYRGHW